MKGIESTVRTNKIHTKKFLTLKIFAAQTSSTTNLSSLSVTRICFDTNLNLLKMQANQNMYPGMVSLLFCVFCARALKIKFKKIQTDVIQTTSNIVCFADDAGHGTASTTITTNGLSDHHPQQRSTATGELKQTKSARFVYYIASFQSRKLIFTKCNYSCLANWLMCRVVQAAWWAATRAAACSGATAAASGCSCRASWRASRWPTTARFLAPPALVKSTSWWAVCGKRCPVRAWPIFRLEVQPQSGARLRKANCLSSTR